MTIRAIIKNIYLLKVLLIFIGFTVMSFGNMTVFTILGIFLLLGGCFMAFRQGMAIGHEACSVTSSIKRIESQGIRKPEEEMLRKAYDPNCAAKIIFGGAIGDYVINCVYIALMLIQPGETAVFVSRLLSFATVIPYWPILSHWHEVYNVLTWDIITMLMLAPFLLPTVQYLGYRRGPVLWAHTEKAMADGKRRAKARSRIGRQKTKTAKSQRPEI